MPKTIDVRRYVAPLREGGSLPAIVEGDDDGLHVLKFHGAGQGPKALVAELIAGMLAQACGLPMPDFALARLDPELARTEPDPEIQELVRASAGLNFVVDYLPGAAGFDPVVDAVAPDLASRIVWFDAFISNVDRTVRNTNLLMWHRRLHLIDHGAALYFHHDWRRHLERAGDRFERIRDHVLLPRASAIADADAPMRAALTPDTIASAVSGIPAAWLGAESGFSGPDAHRRAYVDYLWRRLDAPPAFVEEAIAAHAALV